MDCFDGNYCYANNGECALSPIASPQPTPSLCLSGWIWGGNPASDFISPLVDYYFRRDIIIWGDCVKMRYGSQPSDSPWLWKHMADYTRKYAEHSFA